MTIYSSTFGAIQYGYVGDVHVAILGPKHWTDSEFMEFVDGSAQLLLPGEPVRASLTIMTGPYMTARQRRYGADVSFAKLDDPNFRRAILASSGLERSMVTAFAWLVGMSGIAAFNPDEIEPAVDWVAAVGTFKRGEMIGMIKDMMRRANYRQPKVANG